MGSTDWSSIVPQVRRLGRQLESPSEGSKLSNRYLPYLRGYLGVVYCALPGGSFPQVILLSCKLVLDAFPSIPNNPANGCNARVQMPIEIRNKENGGLVPIRRLGHVGTM